MASKRKSHHRPYPPPVEEDDDSSTADESTEEEESEDVEEVEEEEDEEQVSKNTNIEQQQQDEEFEEDDDRDAIRKLLEPMGKDQLIELLKDAALNNSSLLSRLASAADSDPAHRKIFVHGLAWDCTADVLTAAFSSYGPIEDCKAVVDRHTGKCKGYGFVLFCSRVDALKALKEPQKKIGGRMTSCQLASFGSPGAQGAVTEGTGRRVYVSNVADNVSPERLRSFFAKFGEIEEGPFGYDRMTGKMRGFSIFVYKTVEGCRKALEEPRKTFEGRELNVQRAVEGSKPKKQAAGGVVNLQAALQQPTDLALAYAQRAYMGLNPMVGFLGQGLNPAVGLLGQNAAVGLLNQGVAAAGLTAPMGMGSATLPYGVGLGFAGGGTGFNSTSPSFVGNYASQVAMQGLGAYQTATNLLTSTETKTQSGQGFERAG